MASLFDKIRKDVTKGIEEGIAVVKGGATAVSDKMGELTAEGKRQYAMFDLRSKIQTQMTALGGRTYDVLTDKKNPAADSRAKALFEKIKKLEEKLSGIEGEKVTKTAASGKTAKKGKATPKKPSAVAAKKKQSRKKGSGS